MTLLEEVKNYVRIDYDDDDNDISLMIDVAKSYVSNGFSEFNENNPVHKLLLFKAVKILYDNKDTLTDKLTMNIKLQESLGE